MKYIFLLVISILSVALSCGKKELSAEEALKKSSDWLWSQQSADGGWHSETHAVLRDGRVLTPYILYYLMQDSKNNKKHQDEIDLAISFQIREMKSAISHDSVTLIDYPNYSAAYTLRILQDEKVDTSLQHIIASYLLDQQFIEHRGFTEAHLVYGGWGYGEADLKPGEHGHVDVSHTRRVTQALMEGGYLDEKRRNAIQLFFKGVQRAQDDERKYEGCVSKDSIPYDGGFVSSVVTLATNKCQPLQISDGGIHYPSYATATCDGFIGMASLNMTDSVSYADAKRWLLDHQDMSTIDGLLADDPEQWAEIMHYYHFAVRAEAMTILDPQGKWKKDMLQLLLGEQRPDGSYVNPIGGVNKEDDPLMSTIFCVQAIMACIK